MNTKQLTESQRKLIEALPERYFIKDGQFYDMMPWAEETALEYVITRE